MYFWLKAGVNFNPRVPWGLPPPTPNLTTCVNSQTGKSKQSTKCSKHLRGERKNKGITNFIIRSSVDDLLRHTPDAVIEPSTIEEGEEEVEGGGTNNLDHTSR